jgi:16S rRNA (cytidine1402-2'-O)-methyltransferase
MTLDAALYLVATPIGNLRDITIRALETLAGCDVLACEDTRMTRRLLERYAIRVPRLAAYHEHNAESAGPPLVEAVKAGQAVALVSDAGTPLISDPGYRLVNAARDAGINVIAIPGPSAVLTALAASGLPTDDFRFIGFLPAKDKARRDVLAAHRHDVSTLIAFDSPNRLATTLQTIEEIAGPERIITVARELTKRFESVRTGPVSELRAAYGDGSVKGEIVLLIAPPSGEPAAWTDDNVDALLGELLDSRPAAKAAKEAAAMTGRAKADLYQRCLALKADG